MHIKTGSILALAFFILGTVIAFSNRETLMNAGPGHPPEQQFESVLVWAGLCLLVVSAVKLALAETRSRRGDQHKLK